MSSGKERRTMPPGQCTVSTTGVFYQKAITPKKLLTSFEIITMHSFIEIFFLSQITDIFRLVRFVLWNCFVCFGCHVILIMQDISSVDVWFESYKPIHISCIWRERFALGCYVVLSQCRRVKERESGRHTAMHYNCFLEADFSFF